GAPELSILGLTPLLVAPRAVGEEHREPEGEQVGDRRAEAGGQRPGVVHAELARVVELAPDPPEAGHEELAAERLGGPAPDRRPWVDLEAVLLLVGAPEQDHADREQGREAGDLEGPERLDRI